MNLWTDLRRTAVLFENDTALVLDKPAGVSVMGERHGTDLVRLAADAGETVFPAHRIDKATSGAVLFARQLAAHGDLTRQFTRRTVAKTYLALTAGGGLPERGVIELPLSVGRKNRVRVAANRGDIVRDGQDWSLAAGSEFTQVRTYPSVTSFTRLWPPADSAGTAATAGTADSAGTAATLLAVEPVTGRRHQIRVHLAWIGHPIIGDPLFDRQPTSRTFLHAWRLAFDTGGERIRVEAPPPADFWTPIGDQLPTGTTWGDISEMSPDYPSTVSDT